MEIKLPPKTVYIDKIVSGEICVIRVPKIDIKVGDFIDARIPDLTDQKVLKFCVKNIVQISLNSITVEEAEAEGYCSPDFCPIKEICQNMELRLDSEFIFDTLANTVDISKNEIFRALDLKVIDECQNCFLKKNPKELFCSFWNSFYGDSNGQDISKIEFEVLSRDRLS